MERSATHGMFHKDEKLCNLLIVRLLCSMNYCVSLPFFIDDLWKGWWWPMEYGCGVLLLLVRFWILTLNATIAEYFAMSPLCLYIPENVNFRFFFRVWASMKRLTTHRRYFRWHFYSIAIWIGFDIWWFFKSANYILLQ